MHRGVRVDGATVRNLRKCKGWSQRQLASAAGVSERTVRNAEKGLILESYIANYLADALGHPLNEIIVERAEVSRGNRMKCLIRRISTGYMKAVLDGATPQLIEMLHPKIEWNIFVAPEQNFSGTYHGLNEVTKHLGQATAWWEQFTTRLSDFTLTRSDSEGEMIYFHLTGIVTDETGQTLEVWQTFLCRFDDELVTVIDQTVGMIVQASKTQKKIRHK